MRRERRTILAVILTALLLAACSSTDPGADPTDAGPDDVDLNAPEEDVAEQRFPDVLDAEVEPTGDTWRLSATLSSP